MKTNYLTLFFLIINLIGYSQVGINTTTPNAQLDIRSSNQANPDNTDGILIPKIDTFPLSSPTFDQNGMMVFLTTAVGSNTPGFYYWEAATNAWIKLSTGPGGGTLDDAYNFGGAGQGREVFANTGPLTVLGTDGIVSSGTLFSGSPGIIGSGEKLIWSPTNAAFRAGSINANQWEQFNLGLYSYAFGRNNLANGSFSAVWGDNNQANQEHATVWGEENASNGLFGTVFGRFNSHSGTNSVVWGQSNTVTANQSTVFGRTNAVGGNDNVAWGLQHNIIGDKNTVWGESNQSNASESTMWGRNNISDANESTLWGRDNRSQSLLSTIWGRNNNSNCIGCTVWGSSNNVNIFSPINLEDNTVFGRQNTVQEGNYSTAWGSGNFAQSTASTVFGISNFARSIGETVLGIGATDYSPVSGPFLSGFTSAYGTDRLLVVGNAVDLNFNNIVDNNERRDALVILKNGNTGIGESFPEETLHVSGKIRMNDGFQGDGKVLVGDANGTLSWQDNNSWNITGNSGTNPFTDYLGTNDNTDVVFKRNFAFSGLIGLNNTLFGSNDFSVSPLGQFNTIFGASSLSINANSNQNTAIGYGAMQGHFSGDRNTAIGANTLASAGNIESTALGFNANVNSLFNSTAIGANSYVQSQNSMVLGSIAGINGALTSVNVGIGTVEPQERLHVVGNIRMVDGNQAAGRVLISNANGTASWTNPIGTTNGTLDQAYDFGGPGAGNTIIADAGAVTIAGTDGLVSTGTLNSGALAPSGAGVRMVWNPRKLAFRAGSVDGDQWNDINIGLGSAAFGQNTTASGTRSTAFGILTVASEAGSTAFGTSTTASGIMSTAFGLSTVASGFYSTSFGFVTSASGNMSTAFGRNNTAPSNGETVIGIGATIYTPSANGATQFRAANATDRLFVIGNAIDANNNNTVDDSERSDAMVVLKNGNTGIGSSTPQDRLHVVGNIRMVDGNQAAGRIMVSNANGTASWQNLNVTGWSTIGNTGLSAATNFIGTTNAVDVIFRRSNVRAGRLGVSNTSFGVNALNPAVTGGFNTAIGVQALMNNESGVDNTALGYGALMVNTTGEWNTAAGRASLQANEDGNQNTAFGYQSLRNSVSGNNNTAVGRQALFNSIGNGNTGIGWRSLLNTEGDNNTALGINAGNAITTGSNNIAIGNNAQVAVAADSNQIRIGNTAITLATTQVAWTNPSDRRWKDNILPSNLGLDFINALKPVYYTRNNDEKQRTEYGFIAQELEEMLNQFGASNNGIISKDDKGMYGVRYNDLFAPIVKAIQEQQIIIANQQEEINTLKVELLTMQQQFIQRLEALENHK